MDQEMLKEMKKDMNLINEENYQIIKKKLNKNDDYFSIEEYEILRKYNNN